ncbi:hypothetical protein TB1_022884 [Malus domestica]
MPGIDPKIASHKLHVDPIAKPVIKKKIFHTRTSGNHISGNQQDIGGRIHRRGRTLNIACQHCANNEEREGQIEGLRKLHRCQQSMAERSLSSSLIDLLVDSTSKNQLLSFLDAYSGYNQIAMHEPDKEKTVFLIERGTYYYKVMPFGLNNARATYQ